MSFIDKQVDWLRKRQLLLMTNIGIFAFMIVAVGSRIALAIHNLPPNNLFGLPDVFAWRVTPVTDHMTSWLTMVIFFLICLRLRGFSLRKLSTTNTAILAFGDLLLVLGAVGIFFGAIIIILQNASIWAMGIYVMFFLIGAYITQGHITLKALGFLLVTQVPLYLLWVVIGFPISIAIGAGGLSIPTVFVISPWVNIFETGTWVYPCLMFYLGAKIFK